MYFVRESWKVMIEKILTKKCQTNFSEKHLIERCKNRKVWKIFFITKLAVNNHPSFVTKCYLLDLFQKHEGKPLRTPLKTFIKVGNLKMVDFILNNSLFRWNDWSRELEKASKTGKADVVKCLVQLCSNDWTLYRMKASIFLATVYGHLEVLKILLQIRGYSFAFKTFTSGHCGSRSLIHIASEKGHVEIMQYFVEILDKKRLNMKCCFKCDAKTPIELAIKNSQIDVVKLLCDALDFTALEKANLLSKALSSKEL